MDSVERVLDNCRQGAGRDIRFHLESHTVDCMGQKSRMNPGIR